MTCLSKITQLQYKIDNFFIILKSIANNFFLFFRIEKTSIEIKLNCNHSQLIKIVNNIKFLNFLEIDKNKNIFVNRKNCTKQKICISIFIINRVYIEQSLVVNSCTIINLQTEL